MEKELYLDSCCPFDTSAYTGEPDKEPCPVSLDVPGVIKGLDELYAQGREEDAQPYLEGWLQKANAVGDWRAELSFLSELLGQYRRTASREKGLDTVDSALELIEAHGMGRTVSGATVLLNAATTLKCFGEAERSLPLFYHVARVYGESLDPLDYRMAGLYNNMALSFEDVGDLVQAEKHLVMAMEILCRLPGQENELAVSCCNLAELWDEQDPEDGRIEKVLDKAWDYLNAPGLAQDGYHAFTISKCAPCFDRLGFFLYAEELKERAARIYAGA